MMKTKGIYVGSDRFDDKTKKEKREGGGAHLSDNIKKNNDSILLAIILPPSPDSKKYTVFSKEKAHWSPASPILTD